MFCYFDNAASTRPYDEVVDYYCELLKNEYGNPSALHSFGYEAMKLVDNARREVCSIHGLEDFTPVFTSGATESVNMAIRGTVEKFEDSKKTHIITTGIEHACATNTAAYLAGKGASVTYLSTDSLGRIDPDELKNAMTPNTKIVSVIWVNNETGIIQDLREMSDIVRKEGKDCLLHVDATQGFGKIPYDLSCADLVSVSGHKFHAPKGIGVLYIRKGVHIENLLKGGGQQDDMRSGTVNAPLIAALGKTVSMTDSEKIHAELSKKQIVLYSMLKEAFGEEAINTKIFEGTYAPHILNVSFPGLKGEVILHMLEEKGIYVSTSSACSSRKKRNTVLESMGMKQERINGTVRISLCEMNTEEEMRYLVDSLKEAVGLLRSLRG